MVLLNDLSALCGGDLESGSFFGERGALDELSIVFLSYVGLVDPSAGCESV